MSDQFEKDFKVLVEEQLRIFLKVNEDILNNAMKWHQEHCEVPRPNCDLVFGKAFFALLNNKVAELDITAPLDELTKQRMKRNGTLN